MPRYTPDAYRREAAKLRRNADSGDSDQGTSEDMREAAAMLEDAATLIERTSWQPIATAPKDGTEILACDEIGTLTYVVEWNEPHDGTRGYWMDRHYCEEHVAWWMPIPPRPPQE
jgi:hypothetical protein